MQEAAANEPAVNVGVASGANAPFVVSRTAVAVVGSGVVVAPTAKQCEAEQADAWRATLILVAGSPVAFSAGVVATPQLAKVNAPMRSAARPRTDQARRFRRVLIRGPLKAEWCAPHCS